MMSLLSRTTFFMGVALSFWLCFPSVSFGATAASVPPPPRESNVQNPEQLPQLIDEKVLPQGVQEEVLSLLGPIPGAAPGASHISLVSPEVNNRLLLDDLKTKASSASSQTSDWRSVNPAADFLTQEALIEVLENRKKAHGAGKSSYNILVGQGDLRPGFRQGLIAGGRIVVQEGQDLIERLLASEHLNLKMTADDDQERCRHAAAEAMVRDYALVSVGETEAEAGKVSADLTTLIKASEKTTFVTLSALGLKPREGEDGDATAAEEEVSFDPEKHSLLVTGRELHDHLVEITRLKKQHPKLRLVVDVQRGDPQIDSTSGELNLGGLDLPASLSELQITNSDHRLTTVGRYFLSSSAVTSVILPAGLTNVGGHFLFLCSALTSVILPARLTTVGNYFLSGCHSLTSVILPAGLITVGDYFLLNCRALTSVVLPAGLTTVGRDFLSKCQSLTSLTLTRGIDSIENVRDRLSDDVTHKITKLLIPRERMEADLPELTRVFPQARILPMEAGG
ncbi:leucine-rich repeat domain-containing protein [Alphaproteobacteria bacterium]|nr:leucine-rich repeat domain-containing protein [Alphaproteobacteria bacterium]